MSDAGERTTEAATPEPATPETGAGDAVPAQGTDAGEERTAHAAPVCQVAWCPFCFAVGAVQPIQPEVVEHLLRAGTEMLMAFRSVLDARVGQTGEGTDDPAAATRLEKIDLG